MIYENGSYEQLKDNLMRLPSLVCPNCQTGVAYSRNERVDCACGWFWFVGRWHKRAVEFSKWVFPLIQNTGPVDFIDQLTAVQPMPMAENLNLNGDALLFDMVIEAAGQVLTSRFTSRAANVQVERRPGQP